MSKLTTVLLFTVILLGFVIRIIFLNKFPYGFTPDEASFGYDAYSLLKTGRDQWSQAWPINLRSFGDFKLPLYTYLAMPSIAILGLNEFSTRLPSAIIGTLAIIAVFLMVKALTKNPTIALTTSFLLAISPWHVPLSRGAFEANLTVFLLPAGVSAFICGINKPKLMVISSMFFGLNMFSYHSARFVTPFIVLVLIILYRNELNLRRKKIISLLRRYTSSILILFAFGLIVLYSLSTEGSARASDIMVFHPTDKWMGVFERRHEAVFSGLPYKISLLFSNKPFKTVDLIITNYLTYLSPQFLFTEGAREWTYGMIPGRGVMYLAEIIFVILGLTFLVGSKTIDSRVKYFIFAWLLLSPIPASLTKGGGYAGNRVAVMMPAVQLISAFGVLVIFEFLKKIKIIKQGVFSVIFTLTMITALLFFVEDYFFHTPIDAGKDMLYGRAQAVKYVEEVIGNYNQVIFSRSLSEPQIYVAFFSKWDPANYQITSQDWLRYEAQKLPFVDQLGEYHLGKYTFKNINYNDDIKIPGVLLVGKPDEFPDYAPILESIKLPNNKPVVLVIDPALESLAGN